MGESVKELSSGTLTQANLASDGTLTVFSNNGSTTRVVRDVHVGTSNVTSDGGRFSVDGIPVSTTLENSSGTAVVPPSNSFDIEFVPALTQPTKKTLNFFQIEFDNTSTVNLYPITGIEKEGNSDTRFTYNFAGVSLGTTASVGSATDIVPPFHSGGPFNSERRCEFAKVPAETSYYYFYVDSNSTSQFKRLNYGSDETAQGTDSTIWNASYHSPAMDHSRMKYYGSSNGVIREFDLLKSGGLDSSSSSYTSHTGFYATNTSYASGDAVNNVYFHSQGSSTYIRNLALSTGYGTYTNNAYNTSDRHTIALYNSSEDRYYLLVGAQSVENTTHFGYMEGSVIATNTSGGFTATRTNIITGNFRNYLNGLTGGNNYNYHAMQWSKLDDNILAIPYSATSWRLWKAEGGALVYMNIEITGTHSTSPGSRADNLIPYSDVTQTNTNLPYTSYTGISVQLRTQGVEIT
jgi:hypothetical protein